MSKHRTSSVELFTPDEHAVLAQWLGVEPPGNAKRIKVEGAIKRLRFTEEPGYRTLVDVAAAFIVLENAEARLPQWGVFRDDELVLARKYRDRQKAPDRKVLLQPRHLFTINWADSGPGFSWPVAYYVTWVPIYERFVVTASADSPDALGYCDFALGAFRADTPVKEGAKAIICADWKAQQGGWDQQRWAYLFGTGLITETDAYAWADEVWESDEEDEKIEDTDAA